MPHFALTPNVVRREGWPSGPRYTAAQINVRMDEDVFPQRSPDPPRQGDVPEVGSLKVGPRRIARWPTFVSLNIADIQAVQDDDFGRHVLRATPEGWIQQLPGAQLSFDERGNIRKPSAVAYGSLFELAPDSEYGYR